MKSMPESVRSIMAGTLAKTTVGIIIKGAFHIVVCRATEDPYHFPGFKSTDM